MKFNKKWLEEHVDCREMPAQVLADTLTMAGLEVDSVESVAPPFSNVVIGEILSIEQHPNADKLRVCQVAGHPSGTQQVVCGAANARAGIKIPFALLGAELPGDLTIKHATLRGTDSFGMLCAQSELGLGEPDAGLWELPLDAPTGTDLREWLQLNDHIIEVDLTPNRGDCLSISGLSCELAALTGQKQTPLNSPTIQAIHTEQIPVTIQSPADCASYAGRLIRNIDPSRTTPLWLSEKLRRAGLKTIHPVVDVVNYVMLELGQPMHAFDFDTLNGGIDVRFAQPEETLVLLDGQTVALTANTLIIADHQQALAIAGIMGGAATAVSATTQHIFLESAWFNPVSMAGKARQYGLHTDSSHRFERGVDFTIQQKAIERATELLLAITGGEPGPVVSLSYPEHLPAREPVTLPRKRLDQYLGTSLPESVVTGIFTRLGFAPRLEADSWIIQPPSWRYDIVIEQDLIEEVARVYGYNQLPSHSIHASLALSGIPETTLPIDGLLNTLVARGYREVISYSFISPNMQALFEPDEVSVPLRNPISADMADMRASLVPGLVSTLMHNLNRQQPRAKLFETGLRFRMRNGQLQQQAVLAGLWYGARTSESWNADNNLQADFFDLKGDVEALLLKTGRTTDFRFEPAQHPALHPGQTAAILDRGQSIGLIGALHPELQRKLDIDRPVYVFEIEREALLSAAQPSFQPLSRFPEVRRDIAVVADRSLPVEHLLETVENSAGEHLINLKVFDVYYGEHIDPQRKSIAIGLTFQHTSRTLAESEIVAWMDAIVAALFEKHGAQLRS